MRKISVFGGGVCLVLGAACGGTSSGGPGDAGKQADTGKVTPHEDSGAHDTGKTSGDSGKKPPTDGGGKPEGGAAETGTTPDAGDAAASKPTHVLVTVQGSSSSELIAVNLATHAVDGNQVVADSLATTDGHNKSAPFLLGQGTDTVWRLDAAQPWKIDSSWNVGLAGEPDAGNFSADPYAVVVGGGGFAYVVRYASNFIDVITDTATVDGGAPTAKIDLSSLLQPTDADHIVEATAAALDPVAHMLYVVLGNIDRTTVVAPSFALLCTGTVSTVVGIDTMTRKIVTLNGSGPQGSIALKGFDPVEGGVIYDAAKHRLLIAEAGCTPETGDAGGGTIMHGIETVDLMTATSSMLLAEFSTPGDFPGQITAVGQADVLVSVLYPTTAVYHWDPTKTSLGAVIPEAPLPFAYDGSGHILGAVMSTTDAGSSTDVVSLDLTSGTSTTLVHNPFTIPVSYLGGSDVWPHI